jgi:hypothetical protein
VEGEKREETEVRRQKSDNREQIRKCRIEKTNYRSQESEYRIRKQKIDKREQTIKI